MPDTCWPWSRTNRQILKHFKIRNLFTTVLGGGTTPHLKPDPEVIRHVMRAVAMGPDVTWVIGDNVTDLEAACRAGVRSVFATWGFGRRGEEEPTHTARSFDDLVVLFDAARR